MRNGLLLRRFLLPVATGAACCSRIPDYLCHRRNLLTVVACALATKLVCWECRILLGWLLLVVVGYCCCWLLVVVDCCWLLLGQQPGCC